MQEIKKLFYTYRNGAVADTLRRCGMPHKVIFGLQVPQLAEIARAVRPEGDAESLDLADRLWADSEVRESRLLATYLYPATVGEEKALRLALEVRTREEADMLVFRLLKRLSFAQALLARLEELAADNESARHTASALRQHLQ